MKTVDYDQLHEPTEPQKAPWLGESRLVSLADILLGGIATCDKCQRWQRFASMSPHTELSKKGWSFSVGDKCPICTEVKS